MTPDPLCTELTCDKFLWCQNMVDVPGLCIEESCRAFQRSCGLAAVIIVCAAFAVFADLVFLVMLLGCCCCRWRCCTAWSAKRGLRLSAVNFISACLKLLAWAFCTAGGIRDFIDLVLHHACFNEDGNMRISEAGTYSDAVSILSLTGLGASVFLSPLSAYFGDQLVGLPYARLQDRLNKS